MRNFIILGIIFLSVIVTLNGQNIHKIEVESQDPPEEGYLVCPTPYEDCGKLIFKSSLGYLKFISELNLIKEQNINVEPNALGNPIYTYEVYTQAMDFQQIIIRGPNIADHILSVSNLQPATCRQYIINYKQDVITEKEPVVEPKTQPDISPPEPAITKNPNILAIQNEIKKQGTKQAIWGGAAIISAGAGTYFKLTADKKYQEYLDSTDPEEIDDLKSTVELYDILAPTFFGLAGVCTVSFTIHTVKKSKAKKNLKISLNPQSAQLTFTF